jgi:fucose 4-O-acetylase-like acetyltransferase
MHAIDIYNWDLRETVPDIVEQIEKGRGILKVYLAFGIPLFFYLAGASASFFDERKGFVYYFVSRFKRLMIPFFLAVPFILIPRLYLTQEY